MKRYEKPVCLVQPTLFSAIICGSGTPGQDMTYYDVNEEL